MVFFIISIVALCASLLTFFSGFGLGTILTPVFALFFPVEIAIALTGIVHLLNNLFKFVLIGKKTDWALVLRFGLPAMAGAFLGAICLQYLANLPSIHTYSLGNQTFNITLVKVLIAALMIFFALMEILPSLKNLSFSTAYLPFGGAISGFFGGLSGHQGALRSAFLVRLGLAKEVFIASGITIACLIDFTRIPIYLKRMTQSNLVENWAIIALATFFAFVGAYFGNKLLKKVTIDTVQRIVAFALILLAIALGMGFV